MITASQEVNGHLRILMLTTEWPVQGREQSGLFIKRQVDALRSCGIHVDVYHYRGGRNPLRYLQERACSDVATRSVEMDVWNDSAERVLTMRDIEA